MPRGRPSVGRETYIRIKLRKDTHVLWVEAKRARELKSDDALACHLLSSVTDIAIPQPPLDLVLDGCSTTALESPPRYCTTPLLSSTPATVNPQSHRECLANESTVSGDTTISGILPLLNLPAAPASTVAQTSSDTEQRLDDDIELRLEDISTIMCDDEADDSHSESESVLDHDDLDDPGEVESSSHDNPGETDDIESGSSVRLCSSDQNVRVICAVKRLLELVGEHCRERNCSNTLKLTTSICGCVLTIHGSCKDGHVFYWSSSEELHSQTGGKVMLDNLHLAAAVVLSGNQFSKIKMMFRFADVACLSSTTFYAYQRLYICPVVNDHYLMEQERILTQRKSSKVVLAGDGRCDSPGSSAKYCSYILMDVADNSIVQMVTVDKRQVSLRSPNMERAALKECLDLVLQAGITIEELVTDASSSVAKLLSTKHPTIHHSLDIWHKSKKLKKALGEAGKLRGMQKLLMWSSHIVNHFWYCCRTCGGDVETLKVNWASLLHHVTNEHEWIGGNCEHEPLTEVPTDHEGRELEYFIKTEPAFRALQKLILDKRWMKSLKFYVKFRHTGMLESFNSLLLAYSPKRAAFQNMAYQTRVQLTILDHNNHLQRGQAVAKSGDQLYHRKYRKQSKKWDASPTMNRKTYDYIPTIMRAIVEKRISATITLKHSVVVPEDHPTRIQDTIAHVPPTATHDIVCNKRSRFT